MTKFSEADPVASVTGAQKAAVDDGSGLPKYCTMAQVEAYVNTILHAVNGLVKCDGAGNVAVAVADTDYQSKLAEGAFVDGDKTKLDNIETAATADQTGAQIKAAYEGESDTNAFSDAQVAKLAGIEVLADVTDAVNVNAAGATMNTDTNVSGNSWVLDQDALTDDSNTKVPTQQSVKAYVDNQIGLRISDEADGTLATGANADFTPSKLVYAKTCSDSDGNDVIDLENGTTVGQIVQIYLASKGGTDNAVITPVTAISWTTITLDAATEIAALQWCGGTAGWCILYTNGTVA